MPKAGKFWGGVWQLGWALSSKSVCCCSVRPWFSDQINLKARSKKRNNCQPGQKPLKISLRLAGHGCHDFSFLEWPRPRPPSRQPPCAGTPTPPSRPPAPRGREALMTRRRRWECLRWDWCLGRGRREIKWENNQDSLCIGPLQRQQQQHTRRPQQLQPLTVPRLCGISTLVKRTKRNLLIPPDVAREICTVRFYIVGAEEFRWRCNTCAWDVSFFPKSAAVDFSRKFMRIWLVRKEDTIARESFGASIFERKLKKLQYKNL